MMRDVIKALFVVAITELALAATILILFSTLTTVIKILMMVFVFVSWATLFMRQEERQ